MPDAILLLFAALAQATLLVGGIAYRTQRDRPRRPRHVGATGYTTQHASSFAV